MYFNIFSKDPKSPWSRRGIGRCPPYWRFGTVAAIVLAVIIGSGAFQIFSSAQYASGGVVTTADYVGSSYQGTDSQGVRTYRGVYEYSVDGQQYTAAVEQQGSDGFSTHIRIAYLTSNPGMNEVLYSKTPKQQMWTDIEATLGVAILIYFIIYGIALLGA